MSYQILPDQLDFSLTQGDTLPSLTCVLKEGGAAIDLTDATVVLVIRRVGDDTDPVERTATVDDDPTTGSVTVNWETEDTDTVGTYLARFKITHGDGSIQSVPNDSYIEFAVVTNLS